MVRVLAFLIVVALVAGGLATFADRPGAVSITWLGYEIETSVLVAALAVVLLLALLGFLWSLLRYVLTRPAAVSRYVKERKEQRGLDALSRGLIAVAAGDKSEAQRYATLARKRLPNEALTGLLRAQTAQLTGDRAAARRIFEAMAQQPHTEVLGLRGLFMEARREGEQEAARQFAERAMRRDPALGWSVDALLEHQCRSADWEGALKTLTVARKQKQIDRPTHDRRRAVLLTAQAIAAEDGDIDRARELALEANKLAPDLVPAAELAGRLLASKGSLSRATRLLARAWERAPHPDLALAYAFLRPGDSPRDRLKRVRTLARRAPRSPEGPIALAGALIEARDWKAARDALEPLLEDGPTARVCTLMARIEAGDQGDQGRVREWLARAVRAPRDPAWTADGYVSEKWAPVSPITGALDAFEWKVPPDAIGSPGPEDTVADVLVSMTGLAESETAAEPEVLEGTASAEPDPEAAKADAAAETDGAAEPPAPATAAEDTGEPGTAGDDDKDGNGAAKDNGDAAGTNDTGHSDTTLRPDPSAPGAAAESQGDDGPVAEPGDGAPESEEPPADQAPQRPAPDWLAQPDTETGPKIFVSPRPPDDPGPDGTGDEDAGSDSAQPAKR